MTKSCNKCKQCGGSIPPQQYMGQNANYTAYGRIIEVSHGVNTPGMKGKYTGPNLAHYGPGVNPGFKGGAKKTKKAKTNNKYKQRTKRSSKM